jgi:integrase
MRVTLSLTLKWAAQNRWIVSNPVEGIRLPKKTGGRKIVRLILKWNQIAGIMEKMDEPYKTLVLFLALVPKRIEEAIALRPSDLDEGNILHIRRANSNRASTREFRLTLPHTAELVKKLRQIGEGHEWVVSQSEGNSD